MVLEVFDSFIPLAQEFPTGEALVGGRKSCYKFLGIILVSTSQLDFLWAAFPHNRSPPHDRAKLLTSEASTSSLSEVGCV